MSKRWNLSRVAISLLLISVGSPSRAAADDDFRKDSDGVYYQRVPRGTNSWQWVSPTGVAKKPKELYSISDSEKNDAYQSFGQTNPSSPRPSPGEYARRNRESGQRNEPTLEVVVPEKKWKEPFDERQKGRGVLSSLTDENEPAPLSSDGGGRKPASQSEVVTRAAEADFGNKGHTIGQGEQVIEQHLADDGKVTSATTYNPTNGMLSEYKPDGTRREEFVRPGRNTTDVQSELRTGKIGSTPGNGTSNGSQAPTNQQAATATDPAAQQNQQAQQKLQNTDNKISELKQQYESQIAADQQKEAEKTSAQISALEKSKTDIRAATPSLADTAPMDVSNATPTEADKEKVAESIKADKKRKEEAALAKAGEREQDRLRYVDGYKKYDSDVEATSNDRCAYGSTVDAKYNCAGTESWVKNSALFNQGSQVAGSVATQVMGAAETQKAARQNSQSAFMESGAKIQINTGKMQVALGAMNTLLAAIQGKKSSDHNTLSEQVKTAGKGAVTNSQGIKTETSDMGKINKLYEEGETGGSGFMSSNNAETKAFIDTYDLNSKGKLDRPEIARDQLAAYSNQDQGALKNQLVTRRENAEAEKQRHVEKMLKTATRNAANEQASISGEAKTGAFGSLFAGANQLIQGGFAIKSGKELKKAAQELKKAETTAATFVMPNFGNPGPNQSQGAGSGTVITPTTNQANEQAAVEEAQNQDEGETLGDGFAPGGVPDSPLPPGPAPQFAGPNGAQPVNGSGAVGGGGTGGGEPGASEEPKAEYAANLRDPGSQYVSGGGGYVGGGGGGGSGGGTDLSGILDKLMGKMGEGQTEFVGKPGLDEFGRAPASMAPYSYLDRSVNLFERIHKAYQAKNKSGRI